MLHAYIMHDLYQRCSLTLGILGGGEAGSFCPTPNVLQKDVARSTTTAFIVDISMTYAVAIILTYISSYFNMSKNNEHTEIIV